MGYRSLFGECDAEASKKKIQHPDQSPCAYWGASRKREYAIQGLDRDSIPLFPSNLEP